MKYSVSKSKLQDYLALKIDDSDLFPNEAPKGTSFLDLSQGAGPAVILTKESALGAMKAFLDGRAPFKRLIAWSDTMMLSDLFPWADYGEDDSLEEALSDLNDLDDKSVSGVDPSLRRKAVEEIYQKLAHSI